MEGLFTANAFDPASQNPAYLKFKKLYEKRFGDQPNFASMQGYETVIILIDAIGRASGKENLIKAIVEKEIYPGLQYDLKMNRYGDVERITYSMVIKNGEYVVVE